MAAALQTVALSGATFQNLNHAVTFRIYGHNAGSNVGTASVNDFAFNGVIENTLANDDITNNNTIFIYKQHNGLAVASGSLKAELVIYDLQGRLLYNRKAIDTGLLVISDLQIGNQLLIVRVTTIENQVITKKIIY